MRAIGALAVLTTHVAFQTGDYLRHGTWGVFLARLDVGVAVFFVLSAFLLARPHLARGASEAPPPGLSTYAAKRVVRIAPAYWVTAVLALTLFPANQDASVRQWMSTLLLLDTYTGRSCRTGSPTCGASGSRSRSTPCCRCSCCSHSAGRARCRHAGCSWSWRAWSR